MAADAISLDELMVEMYRIASIIDLRQPFESQLPEGMREQRDRQKAVIHAVVAALEELDRYRRPADQGAARTPEDRHSERVQFEKYHAMQGVLMQLGSLGNEARKVLSGDSRRERPVCPEEAMEEAALLEAATLLTHAAYSDFSSIGHDAWHERRRAFLKSNVSLRSEQAPAATSRQPEGLQPERKTIVGGRDG